MLLYAPVLDTNRDTPQMPTKKPRAQRLETASSTAIADAAFGHFLRALVGVALARARAENGRTRARADHAGTGDAAQSGSQRPRRRCSAAHARRRFALGLPPVRSIPPRVCRSRRGRRARSQGGDAVRVKAFIHLAG